MNGLAGMEKFSHLEDKIYLTIENVKKMRDEKDKLENELRSLTIHLIASWVWTRVRRDRRPRLLVIEE